MADPNEGCLNSLPRAIRAYNHVANALDNEVLRLQCRLNNDDDIEYQSDLSSMAKMERVKEINQLYDKTEVIPETNSAGIYEASTIEVARSHLRRLDTELEKLQDVLDNPQHGHRYAARGADGHQRLERRRLPFEECQSTSLLPPTVPSAQQVDTNHVVKREIKTEDVDTKPVIKKEKLEVAAEDADDEEEEDVKPTISPSMTQFVPFPSSLTTTHGHENSRHVQKYCICGQESYGDMIGCDNADCPIEWFHFSCVGLNCKPIGKWFCSKCSIDFRSKINGGQKKERKV